MRSRLWHSPRLAALAVFAVLPMLGGSHPEALIDSERTAAARTQPAPTVPSGTTAPAWEVEPHTTLVAKADRNRKIRLAGPRGSRVWTASALASHDLPQAALAAYKGAAATMASVDPSCQLPWTLLAGIGRVESDHGRYGGSVLSTDGVSRPAIIGVALNGRGPVAAIHDTDGGKLDRDDVWDRAVGPMQFIPSTWAYAGRDGDRDGKRNPHDLDDAALAAAGYLCSGSGSMLDDSSAKAAIFRYNPSDYYVALVQAFERGYRTGVFVIPSPPAPDTDQTAPRKKRKAGASRDRDGARDTRTASAKPRPKPSPKDDPSPKPAPKPSPKPTPKPSPSPSPSPSPTGPALEGLSGQLSACNGGSWCVGGKQLDLGAASRLDGSAASDYDADGTKETVAAELAGLEGKTVNLQVGAGTAPAVVYVINGEDYRFADGSFA